MVGPLSASQLAERIDAVDYDVPRAWNTSAAAPLVFTYRFETGASDDFPWDFVSGFSTWSQAAAELVRDALGKIAEVANVEFVPATAGSDADFSFFLASSGFTDGIGRFYWDYLGNWDGWVALDPVTVQEFWAPWLILHEIGHSLGLKHTGNYDVGGELPPGPFLPTGEDSKRLSVMSYNDVPGLDTVYDLGQYDIAALQARFGANMRHTTGDDTYTGPREGSLQAIWDAGGKDTFSASGVAASVRIDLRPGTFSDFAHLGELAIAYGATIENAVGAGFGDVLRGNVFDNRLSGLGGNDRLFGGNGHDILVGGAGADKLRDGTGRDVVRGGGGNDRFFADAGNDRLFGGKGRDTYVADGKRADHVLTDLGNGLWRIDDGQFVDRLAGIDVVVFDDGTLLL